MSTIIDKLNDEAFNDYQSRDAGNPQNPADARCNQVNRDMNTETAPNKFTPTSRIAPAINLIAVTPIHLSGFEDTPHKKQSNQTDNQTDNEKGSMNLPLACLVQAYEKIPENRPLTSICSFSNSAASLLSNKKYLDSATFSSNNTSAEGSRLFSTRLFCLFHSSFV